MERNLSDFINEMQSKKLATFVKPLDKEYIIKLVCDADLRAMQPKIGEVPLGYLISMPENYDILSLYKERN